MENASLTDLDLKYQYRTNPLNPEGVVGDFYIPVLSVAKQYDRLSGFFSSASFAVAARGVAALIANGGKMRLICSPRLSEGDAKVIEVFGSKMRDDALEEYWRDNFELDAGLIEADHVAAFGWMLQNGILEIKLAVPVFASETTMCHPKIGIVEDFHGHAISFSGSNNETASGWALNQEEFKVFRMEDEGEYFANDRAYFDAYWQNVMPGVKCVDVPDALKAHLIKRSAEFSRESYIAKHCVEKTKALAVWKRLQLRSYQNQAIKKWEDNGHSLMFEMATGSGKTRTAIGCINRMMESESCGCIAIAAPRIALCSQWRRETVGCLVKSAAEIEANSVNANWEQDFAKAISRIELGTSRNKFIILYASHATASGDRFLEYVERCMKRMPVMLVADEAHGLGAHSYRNALYPFAKYRVGLSATPSRLFDDVGTRLLVEYFGSSSFVFSIGDALRAGYVSPYRYYPIVVRFTLLEQEKYDDLTEKIRKLRLAYENSCDVEIYERLEKALRDRAVLVAAAQEKIPALRSIIGGSRADISKFSIAFACSSNIDAVVDEYRNQGIIARRYTSKESPSLRGSLLRQFAEGECPVLVAMKCLDEGVDVPAARCAMIVSSTVNPREYIQRIGRVIRKAPGKQYADIYDFLVSEHAAGVVERDMNRGLYIAQFADNATEALDMIYRYNGGLK